MPDGETKKVERRITIDPITRLEGHGKIEIFLNDQGSVDRAFFQVPELRGFEKFAQGRPAEEMPQITSRICGVCPTAHHMASTKALDALYRVTPPPAAKKIRELFYSCFVDRGPRAARVLSGRPGFHRGAQGSGGRTQRARRHRQSGHRGRPESDRDAPQAA